MIIGIICAMPQELAPLRDQLENAQIQMINSQRFYTGKLNGKDVVLTVCGIGKVHAAVTTTLMITRFKTDCIINTGSAGGLLPSGQINIGDVVVSDTVAYHDVNLTVFGYKIGQLPQHEQYFRANLSLVEKAMSCQEIKLHKGLIVSGDQFIGSDEQHQEIVKNFPQAMACEMEGAAVAHVCFDFKVPFVLIRSISDTADHTSSITFDDFLPTAAQNASTITLHLLEHL